MKIRQLDILDSIRERLPHAPQAPVNVSPNPHLPEVFEATSRRQAGILIALIQQEHNISIFVTQRSAKISDGGTWCFPGGRLEEQDNQSLITTALREGEEEAGIPQQSVEVLGTLAPCHDRTHSLITPVIGLIRGPVSPVLCETEVSDYAEIPLKQAIDPNNFSIGKWRGENVERHYHHFTNGEVNLYGISGGILRQFRDFATNTPSNTLSYNR